jgi:hypothetical protein
LDGQDRNVREELQGSERRWERQLNEQDRRLEARIEEQEMRFQDGQKEAAYKMQSLAVRVDDALVKMTEDTRKAPWERRVEEAAIAWRKELEDTLAERPTSGDLAAYTTLVTTEKIVSQLANLQVRTDEQYNGLQGGLNTLERLYLRQLDQTADMVSLPNELQNSLIQYIQNNVPQQLQQFLSTQQAEDRVRPPLLPGLPMFHQPPLNWLPSGRIAKGLPRRARATSGPPDTPTRAGPSTIPVSPLVEKADVEMKDTGVSEGEHVPLCPGIIY